ncbi:MAG: ABC transporter permease [Vallitaleaceae bacterium]|jgi:lipoprotein-releasing system permease protein|nr:ABC transporter permease [Vallitaleaceae bacterium]
MRLSLQIANRFLRFSKGQTILIALGIAVGVSVQVFIGLLIQGLQDGLIDTTIGNAAHITVSTDDSKGIDNYSQIINDIEGSDLGITAITPSITGNGFLKNDETSEPIFVKGYDLASAEGIYEFADRISEGRLPRSNNEVLIGIGLADNLGVLVNDTTDIFLVDGTLKEVMVVGFLDFNVSVINNGWVVTGIDTASSLFGYENAVGTIEIQVDQVFEADAIGAKVAQIVNNDKLIVDNWKDQNAELLSGLNGQSISSLMIQIFVLVAVVLGIASVLAITVIQKSKQIGILKAMGITDGKASSIFLLQGFILGIIGAALGILFGLLLSYAFATFALNPDGTPVIPLSINYNFILTSGMIAVVSAMIASVMPARRSSKLTTIEVIRNG